MKRVGERFASKIMAVFIATMMLLGLQPGAMAQDEYSTPPASPDTQARPPEELDQLLGPIALYPDPLLGIILPAATVPSQIVAAEQYLSEGGDTNQIAQQPWDPSVQDLAHYPELLKWMNDNITWTTELGVAFSVQQSDVMDSVQRLRAQAQSLGNLQTSPQEDVETDDGDIDIEPANPDEIYVPDYQPDLIYTQPGVYCTFGLGFPIGLWLGYDWNWHDHHLIHWTADHPRPRGWWQQGGGRRKFPAGNANLWRPRTAPAPIIVRGGADRGYGNVSAARHIIMPRVPAPREAARPAARSGVTVIGRSSEPARAVEPRASESRPEFRAEPSESAFGGAQSSREVRESSSRGEASRQVSFGGGGGGGRSSGGGGRR